MIARLRLSASGIAAVSGILVAAGFLGACGNKDPQTPANQGAGGGTVAWGTPGQGGYANAPAAQGGYANAPATNPTGPATATTAAPPPTTPTATATTAAPPIDPTLLQALLTPLAQKNAPGAKPEGSPVSGMAQTGVPLTTPVTLQPSGTKCYTAIGVAGPGVTDISVELWANPAPLPPAMLSTSSGTGVSVVMAGAPNCYKNLLPIPIPAQLKITARAGAGPVLAQLYAK